MREGYLLYYLSIFLFSTGLFVAITKRNAIMILVGIELMLNAANLNLIVFNQHYPAKTEGVFFALFIIVVAVCEAAVGLAILLKAYQFYRTSIPDKISDIKES